MEWATFALGAVGGAVVGVAVSSLSESTVQRAGSCSCSKGSKGPAGELARIRAMESELLRRARADESPARLAAGVGKLTKAYRAYASRTGERVGGMTPAKVMRGLLDEAGRDGAVEVRRWRAGGAR